LIRPPETEGGKKGAAREEPPFFIALMMHRWCVTVCKDSELEVVERDISDF
jgi:hypothetical protein